jgi:hypothetical protein
MVAWCGLWIVDCESGHYTTIMKRAKHLQTRKEPSGPHGKFDPELVRRSSLSLRTIQVDFELNVNHGVYTSRFMVQREGSHPNFNLQFYFTSTQFPYCPIPSKRVLRVSKHLSRPGRALWCGVLLERNEKSSVSMAPFWSVIVVFSYKRTRYPGCLQRPMAGCS